jgi:glycosyltransferase involved in cell wall biosynthesis
MQSLYLSKNIRKILFIGNFLSDKIGTIGPSEELAYKLKLSGWQIFKTSHKLYKLPRLIDMIYKMWRWSKEFRVAHLDVYSGPAFFWAEAATASLRFMNKPYILSLHGGNLPDFGQRWPGRVRRLLAGAAAVTCPSPYLFQSMRSYRQDLMLLPNPLEISMYKFQIRKKPSLKIVWLRAFHGIYNPSLAPLTLARLVETYPEVSLTMVGPDKGDGSFQHTQKVSENLGISEHITYPGKIQKSQVPYWMNKGDIFLNTTNFDNTPVSVMEAMACGLCVVSTNVGGIPYLLDHETDALLVPPDDPEAMAAAVRRILIEPDLAERLSRNARKKAEHYDWSVILPQWEELLLSIGEQGKLALKDELVS